MSIEDLFEVVWDSPPKEKKLSKGPKELKGDQKFDPALGRNKLPMSMEIGTPTEWIDFRVPELRLEGFIQYYGARRASHDLDHTHYYTTIAREKNLEFDEAIWLSLLFGQTYKVAMANAYYHTFPDFHSPSVDDVVKWNSDNWKRTRYGTDARYNKGHFAEQFESVKKWLRGSTFKARIEPLVSSSDEMKNFRNLFEEVVTFRRFGRMSSWLACQAMWDILRLPINARTVLIEDSSNWSCYNGVMFIVSQEDKIAGEYNEAVPGYRPTDADRALANAHLERIWRALEERYPEWVIDGFRLETALCQYKKLYTGWEYIGHASGDANQSLAQLKPDWPEVDFGALEGALLSQPPQLAGRPRIKMLNTIFQRYGMFINMDLLPDGCAGGYSKSGTSGFELLGIDPPERLF